MKNAFLKIDSELSNFVKVVKDLAGDLEFKKICEFRPGESLCSTSWDSFACPGVYLIEIKNDGIFDNFKSWADNFKHEWERPELKYQFVPNLKQKRIEKHPPKLEEWIPIYIGKSRWLGNRIKEHLYLDLNRRTFALKLSSREGFSQSIFRISIIPVEVANYDWIVPIIENTLRDKINPIIGRQ